MAYQAVIFDIGNVLIQWQPERFYDAYVGEHRRRALFEAVDLHRMNDEIDRGGPFRDIVYATAELYPAFRQEIQAWHAHWIEMARPEIPHSVKLLRTLRARGTPVFALSNFGIDTFAFAQTHYPVLSEFDRPYISGHMGVTKPDAEIYRMVEDDCGIPPGALLFVDDRQDNVAAAAGRGWGTHLFDGPDGWAGRLVAEGLLSPGEAAA